ncbi:YlbF family regulator [Paenibacillus validus]|uniref:YlbF family regulator n=1 Tax=Paenibacillus validus TaxID=44253 RepID=UPI000FDB8FBC|nr:YlbF family regulator [Paenibacillus validus]MED4603184.1 YlbF family regulator [Paenibacillus validus]MED4609159.1 YlbF family regulator [Paenibacillus validus]
MNMYDKAYELARAIRESQETKELKALRERIDADSDTKRMLDDFRSRQMELQQKMMAGEMPPKEELEKLEKLFEVVNLNPLVRSYFETERRFGVIMEDIQRIIAEPLGDVLK